MEVIGEFNTFSEWQSWLSENAGLVEQLKSIDIEGVIAQSGLNSPVFGKLPPELVAIRSKNYRESIVARRLNSRQRALIEILAKQPAIWGNPNAAIYAAEAVTPFALFMRGRFSRFMGSEYTSDPARKTSLYPIPIEDLNRLTLPSGVFDCAITNDVLEHVPSISLAMSELHRILKPGGLLLSTFPFTNKPLSAHKAELIEGKVTYHTEPEYHGNPMDPKGSLVFTVPGWDILETTKNAGFSVAKIIKFASSTKAIWGANTPFIDVLYAEK